MTVFAAFLVLALIMHGVALPFVDRGDRRLVSVWMSIAWICLFLVLAVVNQWSPFSREGDDASYFDIAATSAGSLADVFDLTRFTAMEQPGYPWLLSTVGYLAGHDLLVFKAINLACFVLLLPIWYCIGFELGARRFGRMMVIVILLLTPLWYYWMFLLKDIVIVLLQSLFLLGAIMVYQKHRSRGWLLILFTTLAIIPFRSQLVLVHIALVIGMIGLVTIGRDRQRHIVRTTIIAIALVVSIVSYASDRDWMASIGIHSETRVIGSRIVVASLKLGDQSSMNRALFPLLYFVTETSGFSPATWTDFEGSSLRGVLAIPWIVAVCPFAMFGFAWIFGRDPSFKRPASGLGVVGRVRSSRAVTSPWGVVVMFISISMVVSWVVGDTTRWRLADMPAIAAVSAAGWLSLAPSKRVHVVGLWVGVVGGALLLFYFIRGS